MFYLLAVVFLNFSIIIEATAFNNYYGDMNSPTYFANEVLENIEAFDLGLSPECEFQMLYYAKSLLSSQKTFWALKMFDAGTKIPSGIFAGSFVDLGSFEECIDIYDNATTEIIFGKYCLGVVSIFSTGQTFSISKSMPPSPEIGLRVATCLPSACSADEIQRVYRKLFLPLKFDEELCQVKASQPKLDNADITMISFLGIVFGLIFSSTVYDGIILYLKKKPFNPVLLAFSVITNGKKLIKTTNKSDQISCIDGIRVLTMMWIILAHKYALTLLLPVKNTLYFLEFINEPANMFVFNAYVSVDTFFLLGGVVLVYAFLSAAENGVKFNVIFYYVHRYLRLTPSIAVIVGIYLTIVKHFGSGPLWPSTVDYHLVTSCDKTWWRTLLYIQNFGLTGEEMCIGQTWYLGVDFQLFLISPILLLPLKQWPKITLTMIGLLSVCSSVAAFLTSWFLEIGGSPSSQTDLDTSEKYMKYYYYATWIRCSPWLIGMVVGYAIFKIKRDQKELFINKIILLLLWTASLAVLYACVFEGYDVVTGKGDKVANAFHMAFARPAWAIALSWIIFACTTGYGGPVDWFLSLPVFQVLSKLTYSMYLTHYAVLLIIGAQMVTPPVFTNFQMLYNFWSDFMCTVAVSTVLSLAFESPVIAIAKYIFQKSPQEIRRP